jgi:hypothetical protein
VLVLPKPQRKHNLNTRLGRLLASSQSQAVASRLDAVSSSDQSDQTQLHHHQVEKSSDSSVDGMEEDAPLLLLNALTLQDDDESME